MPFIPGIEMSVMTTSGWRRTAASTRLRPSLTVPTTSTCSLSKLTSSAMISGWSSAIRTLARGACFSRTTFVSLIFAGQTDSQRCRLKLSTSVASPPDDDVPLAVDDALDSGTCCWANRAGDLVAQLVLSSTRWL